MNLHCDFPSVHYLSIFSIPNAVLNLNKKEKNNLIVHRLALSFLYHVYHYSRERDKSIIYKETLYLNSEYIKLKWEEPG